ncbi:MAG: NADP-dependent oxidoreductase [Vulcanimicrobiaceae bacterium]
MSVAPEVTNRQVKLIARPIGLPKRTDFEIAAGPMPSAGPGEVLVAVEFVSLDPAMRGWMSEGKSYLPPVRLGDVMRAGGVGRIVASDDPDHPVGDYVVGITGVQQFVALPARALTTVDARRAPLPRYLGALGMPGMTAYFGLLDIGKPTAGETVVVSGAAGAVGAIVGQIAKIHGARVVGIAGGAAKCAYLRDLGFDVAIDYKNEDVQSALAAATPRGIDIFFDNVGGETLDAALARLAMRGRVIVCGAISQYNTTTSVRGPSNYLSLLINRGTMTGMIVLDYAARYPTGVRDIAAWLAAGTLHAREDVVAGIDTFPETLLRLFHGENFGKLVLAVAN